MIHVQDVMKTDMREIERERERERERRRRTSFVCSMKQAHGFATTNIFSLSKGSLDFSFEARSRTNK